MFRPCDTKLLGQGRVSARILKLGEEKMEKNLLRECFLQGVFFLLGVLHGLEAKKPPKSPQKASSKGLPAYTQASPLLVAKSL